MMENNILYYSDVCPDTPGFIEVLKEKGVDYQEVNINKSIPNLKAFLKLRDNRPEFEPIKDQMVGVPVLLSKDKLYFDANEVEL